VSAKVPPTVALPKVCLAVQVLAAARLRVIALEEPVPVTVKLFNGPLMTSVKKLPV